MSTMAGIQGETQPDPCRTGLSEEAAAAEELPFSAVHPKRYAEFARVAAQQRSRLLRVARRITVSEEDAEDVVQESALRALASLPLFRGEASMETWLYTIVINTARNWRRSHCARTYVSLDPADDAQEATAWLQLPDPGRSPEEACTEQRMRRFLLAEIQTLHPMYRRPILACDLGDQTYSEAAVALNLKLCTLKARLYRGRAVLRRKLHPLDPARPGRPGPG